MASSTPPSTERLRGTLHRVRFTSDDGQFSVAELAVDDRVAPVTLVGNLMAARPGETLEVIGQWKDDPTYGRQFQVRSIETALPSTEEGIVAYLGGDMIDGIGPKLAARIVDHFGDQTLEVIDRNPSRLSEVEGIGDTRAHQIAEAWQRDRTIHRLMIALRSHGISPAHAVKIHQQFGADALSLIQRNPYRLAEDIRGIGFQTADQIARHFDIDPDSPERLRAGLLYTLRNARNDGHVYLPLYELKHRAYELLGDQIGAIDDALEQLEADDKIARQPLDGDQIAIYPIAAYHAERGAADHLRRIARRHPTLDLGDTPQAVGDDLEAIEQRLGVDFAKTQRRAIASVFEDSLCVITGGPGTGKTTIVEAICHLADRHHQSIDLAAPTGRAARRLAEATGRRARTLHRLLEFSFDEGGFQRHEDRPLELDILVVDEASMIDIFLLYSLVRALPDRATLVLVGDIDQLPSVGPGQVLRDLIDARPGSVVRLTEIFRQDEASTIITNAHRINAGHMPIAPPREGGELVDFYTINAPDPDRARQTILNLATQRIPDAFGFHPLDELQILSPMYRGDVGCDGLNQALQQHHSQSRPRLQSGSSSFYLGDRVMQTTNNYDNDVFNGDIGRVVDVDLDDQNLSVDFDGRRVLYPTSRFNELTLAYAITIHKSQGSEYPAVIIPVMTQHYVMLQRNLLYTAVTRASQLVVLVGTSKAVEIAVNNQDARQRFSLLRQRLDTIQ